MQSQSDIVEQKQFEEVYALNPTDSALRKTIYFVGLVYITVMIVYLFIFLIKGAGNGSYRMKPYYQQRQQRQQRQQGQQYQMPRQSRQQLRYY